MLIFFRYAFSALNFKIVFLISGVAKFFTGGNWFWMGNFFECREMPFCNDIVLDSQNFKKYKTKGNYVKHDWYPDKKEVADIWPYYRKNNSKNEC